MASKHWVIAPPITRVAEDALAGYPPILRQILFNRGYADAAAARAFLHGYALGDTDPFGLMGMQASVDRLQHAVRHSQKVAVYGDYDTDGVTATALLVQTLQALGADVVPYIPHRHEEGYGLNPEALDTLKAQGVAVVVTVDCGVRSLEEVEHGRSIGLDMIVTDHHHPGDELPNGFAVINPKQPGDRYSAKELAGVGLAFKLAEALLATAEARGESPKLRPADLLDLVALGTVADLAPLSGENRMLVRGGLKVLNQAKRVGVRKLLEVSRSAPGEVNAGTIGFALGPRLNAAGRLDSALAAYRLLTTVNAGEAADTAAQLEMQNRERQVLTRQVAERARELALEGQTDAALLFAAHPDFNSGVVGLAAARLTEEFYRPAVVAFVGPKNTRGSARSIREFHITAALDQCRDLLVRHGGHAAAAGFTVANERAGDLADRLRSIAATQLDGQDLRPTIWVDAVVKLSDLDWALAGTLEELEPCGYANPTPVLVARDVMVTQSRAVGADGAHLKLTLSDGRRSFDAIAFRQGSAFGKLAPRIDVVFRFEVNEYNGEKRLQLNVVDFRKSGEGD